LILFQGSSALKSLHFAGFFILSSIFSDLIPGKVNPAAGLSQLIWIYIMCDYSRTGVNLQYSWTIMH